MNPSLRVTVWLTLPVFILLASAAAEARQPAAAGDRVILTFLGTGAPRPSLERYGPSILVEAGEKTLLVDAGPGMRERLFQAGGFQLLTSVETVLITHLHFDHTISVPGLWLAGWLFGRRVPLYVFGPAGTEEMMSHLQQAYRWDIDYRAIVGVPRQGTELHTRDIGPGVFYERDGLKITAFAVEHLPMDPDTGNSLGLRGQTLGFRIDYGSRSVVFSGDTRSTGESALLEYGRGVDVLIHEVQVPSPGSSREARLANISLSVHSTPKQASEIFSRTRPRLAVYSHIIPPGTTRGDLVEASRPYYQGPLTVAHDLMRITVGEEITSETIEIHAGTSFEESRVLDR